MLVTGYRLSSELLEKPKQQECLFLLMVYCRISMYMVWQSFFPLFFEYRSDGLSTTCPQRRRSGFWVGEWLQVPESVAQEGGKKGMRRERGRRYWARTETVGTWEVGRWGGKWGRKGNEGGEDRVRRSEQPALPRMMNIANLISPARKRCEKMDLFRNCLFYDDDSNFCHHFVMENCVFHVFTLVKHLRILLKNPVRSC